MVKIPGTPIKNNSDDGKPDKCLACIVKLPKSAIIPKTENSISNSATANSIKSLTVAASQLAFVVVLMVQIWPFLLEILTHREHTDISFSRSMIVMENLN